MRFECRKCLKMCGEAKKEEMGEKKKKGEGKVNPGAKMLDTILLEKATGREWHWSGLDGRGVD